MKKLEKLTLKELVNSEVVLNRAEAIGLKGGDGEEAYYSRYGTALPDGCSYNQFNDTVSFIDSYSGSQSTTGYSGTTISQGPCPQCEAFHNHNENNSLGGVDGEPVLTPIGEFFANTLPHMMGWGNHINGSE